MEEKTGRLCARIDGSKVGSRERGRRWRRRGPRLFKSRLERMVHLHTGGMRSQG